MTTTPKRTSFMRYQRVLEILQGDNALRKRLSKNMAAVCRPDQTHKEYPVEVVHVTDEIHKEGLDAYTLSKIEVIRFAHRLLVANHPTASPSAPPDLPVKEAKVPKAAKLKEKPKPKLKKAIVPKSTAAAESPIAAEPKTGEDAVLKVPDAVFAKVPEVIPIKVPEAKAPPSLFIRPHVPHIPGIAVMNCLFSAFQLMEPFCASDPDARDLCQRIQTLIDELHRRTILPADA